MYLVVFFGVLWLLFWMTGMFQDVTEADGDTYGGGHSRKTRPEDD
jgi:hypothetical protein